MQIIDFESIKNEFLKANIDKKIDMYVSAEGLTEDQYKELLRLFPISELSRLEEAL